VEFTVRDNGIGIAPEDATRVFKMFQRLHHREQYEGTGIGLAVCQRIVERHGGEIHIEAGDGGRGSSFVFTVRGAGSRA
jgi:signal transduction histidine kinase